MTKSIQLTGKEIIHFWSKVNIGDDNNCWQWKGGKYDSGYGKFYFKGIEYPAHRVAWQIKNGRAPRDGYDIAHAPVICHNRLCCNPSHLSEKTRKENLADRKLDGTMNSGNRNGLRLHPESVRRGEKSSSAKLNQSDIEQIRALRKQGIIQRIVASRFGVSRSQISYIEHEKAWKPP